MILVAGGTGFTGRAIVRALRSRGHRVRVLSRGSTNPWPDDDGIELARGDVRDRASLEPAMAGVTCVIGAVQFPGHPVEVPAKGLTYDEYDRKAPRTWSRQRGGRRLALHLRLRCRRR
jgi:uncharacterized protein YbjT (DUF2867 family)